MRLAPRWNHSLRIAALAALLSGCGEQQTGPDVLYPVTGTVSVDGQPAAGVSLTFLPAAGTSGTGGTAASDAQGQFTVKHRSGQDGIEPGKYRVVLSRMLTPEGNPVPTGESAMDHNASETMPEQYTNPEITPLEANVTENTQPLSFDVSTTN